MSATSLEQEREELNDEILQIKRTLQWMEDDGFSEEEDDSEDDALCVDLEYKPVSSPAVEPVAPVYREQQGTSSDPALNDEVQSSVVAESSSTFSSLPQSFHVINLPGCSLPTVLSLNRAYQNVLQESLQRVQSALSQNKERQETIGEEMEQSANERMSAINRKNVFRSYCVPFFKDANGMNPPMNDDTLMKRAAKEGNQFVRPPKQWTASEQNTLKKSVLSDALRRHMRPLMNRKEVLMEKQFETTAADLQKEISTEVLQLDEKIMQIKDWPEARLLGNRTDTADVDWLKISSLDFDGERSEAACELMWRNALHPSINTSKWRSSEDKQLDEVVKRHAEKDWTAIADELATNRTPFQCLQRYQTRLNPCLATGKWTAEEDKFLLEIVEAETDDAINWNQVVDYLEGRSQEQCAARYAKLNENPICTKWKTDEDMKLIQAVQWFGNKAWINVAKFVPGRTDTQCRERWTNALDNNLTIGNWKYEEDRTIWMAVQKVGAGKWTKISPLLPGRTDNMIMYRYQRMKRCRDAEERLAKIPMTKVDARKKLQELGRVKNEPNAKMIREDKAKGINIPRISCEMTCRLVKRLELRGRLHEMIKLRVQRDMALDRIMPTNIDDMIESACIDSAHSDSDVGTVRSMLDAPVCTVRSMIDASVRVKHNMESTGKRTARPKKCGRKKNSAEEHRVAAEITELLHVTKGKRYKGRPRLKQYADVCVENEGAGGDNQGNSMVQSTQLARLFFQTLEVDVTGMSKRRAREGAIQPCHSVDVPSSSSHQPPSDGGQNTKTDLELWDAVAMETTQIGASGDRVRKRALVMELGGIPLQERLSAIPPNTTTLNAFKSLLLRRSDLLAATRKRAKPIEKKKSRKKASALARAAAVAIPSSSSAYSNKVKVKEYLAAKKSKVEPPGDATVAVTETSDETSINKSTVEPPGGATVAESITETSEETSANKSTVKPPGGATVADSTETSEETSTKKSTVEPPGGATVTDSVTETSEETSTNKSMLKTTGGATVTDSVTKTSEGTSKAKSTVEPPGGATVADSVTKTSEGTSKEKSTVEPPGGATVADSVTETSEESSTKKSVTEMSEETSMTQMSMAQVRQTGSYELLRERMRALFLWPAMLSAIPLSGLGTCDARKTNGDLPADSKNDNTGLKKKGTPRYPCSRGKKYQKFKLQSLEVKAIKQEQCRKNVRTRIRNRENRAASANSPDAGNTDFTGGPEKLEDPEKESNAVVKIEGVPGKTGRPRGGGKKRFLLPTPNVRQTRARTRKNADLVTVIPDADVVTVTPGADLVTVTSGADLVTVIPGADLVTVTPDADVVTVTPGADLVTVTPGADLVTVTPDADVVTVTPDADVVTVTPGADLVTVIPGAAPEVFTTLLPEGSVCLGTFTLPLVLSSADVQQVPMETDVALSGDM